MKLRTQNRTNLHVYVQEIHSAECIRSRKFNYASNYGCTNFIQTGFGVLYTNSFSLFGKAMQSHRLADGVLLFSGRMVLS